MKTILLRLAGILLCLQATASTFLLCAQGEPSLLVNGIPWYDQHRRPVNAHGACILREQGKYWLFGEHKSDTTNAFSGFSCYSSDDLVHWRFERMALPVQPHGLLGPGRVGERVKVMRCPQTGMYVMLMHADDLKYNDPHIALATSPTIDGPYQFRGPLRYRGEPIRRWDMGTFQDTDGTGYLLIHHGPIYRLSPDYLSVDTLTAHIEGMGESPALFQKDGIYYLLTSNLTSWERNDNFYFTATCMAGPWRRQGLFCPPGTLTWNSQSTYVLMLPDGTPMYMGDRWSYPRQASAATYVWLPMQAEGEKLSIPAYWPSWDVASVQPADAAARATGRKPLLLHSNRAGESVRQTFTGTHAALYGRTDAHGGYARISVLDASGHTVHSGLIDFYSKVPQEGLRAVTPTLPYGEYVLEVEVTGERPVWSDKRKNLFGSDDCYVYTSHLHLFGR